MHYANIICTTILQGMQRWQEDESMRSFPVFAAVDIVETPLANREHQETTGRTNREMAKAAV